MLETPEYFNDAKYAGMTQVEREAVVSFVAANPQSGDLLVGTGGARKVRFRRPAS